MCTSGQKFDFEGFRPGNVTKQGASHFKHVNKGMTTGDFRGIIEDAGQTTGDLFMGRMKRKQQQQDALPGDPHAEAKPDQSGTARKRERVKRQRGGETIMGGMY